MVDISKLALPSKEQVMELPLYDGLKLSNIHIVETEKQAEIALQALKNETNLGFDTESKPIFKKGVVSPGPTLIQLATPEQAFLFPTRFDVAKSTAEILLSDSKIQKVGFGLKGDRKELKGKLGIQLENTQDLAVTVKNLIGVKNQISARNSVAMVLKQRLGKGAQKSNWGAYPLSRTQILYAANDAHSAICVLNELNLTD